jgi:hypothetical protein
MVERGLLLRRRRITRQDVEQRNTAGGRRCKVTRRSDRETGHGRDTSGRDSAGTGGPLPGGD